MSAYPGDNQSNAKSTPREKFYTRWGHLKSERSSWFAQWQTLSKTLLPYSGRFFIQDRNKGWNRFNDIYDNTATRALRVLAAGMMSGMTSPARPWFRLTIADQDLAKNESVKVWLYQVSELMRAIFSKSNAYRSFHSVYEELGVYGTAASLVVPSYSSVIHQHTLTCGEFAIATDWSGQVVTLYREFQKTIHEIVKEFGLENCSNTVQSMYRAGSLDQWVTIVHAIEPRSDRDPRLKDSKNMPWRSCYFEVGANHNQLLRESGYKRFPGIAPRWGVSGGDVYGNSPGMECLGDIRQLQQEQLRKAQGIDYMTQPPLQVPYGLKAHDMDSLPGGIAYVDQAGPGIKTQFDVNLNLSWLLADIQDVRSRINSSFFTDLFLMLANDNNTQMTATEVSERKEEKILMLGPVLERLFNEMLDPMISITFDHMLEAGIVPRPPPELQGMDLQVEFTSIFAQVMKASELNSVDRFVFTLGKIASFKPDILDKFNSDFWPDMYADAMGVNPELITPSNQVALIRQQRAKAQQAEQQAAMAQPLSHAANAAQTLSNIDPSQLQDVMSQFSGYTQ